MPLILMIFFLSQINASPSKDSPDVGGCDEHLLQP